MQYLTDARTWVLYTHEEDLTDATGTSHRLSWTYLIGDHPDGLHGEHTLATVTTTCECHLTREHRTYLTRLRTTMLTYLKLPLTTVDEQIF